jgi:hypothetical protein
MGSTLPKARRNCPPEDAPSAMANDGHGPGLFTLPPPELSLDLPAQSLRAARIYRQGRADWPKANPAQPRPQGIQVPVVPEKAGQDKHVAAIATGRAGAIVNRVAEELRKFGNSQRLSCQRRYSVLCHKRIPARRVFTLRISLEKARSHVNPDPKT